MKDTFQAKCQIQIYIIRANKVYDRRKSTDRPNGTMQYARHVPKRLVAMYLALDVATAAYSEQSMRRRHFGLAVKFGAAGGDRQVRRLRQAAVRRLPRVFYAHAAASVVVVPDNADRAADVASAGARLGGGRRASTPDDVGQVRDEEVVRQSPDAAARRERRPSAAARTQQVAVVRQQEPVRPVLLVHLVVRFQALGAERVLAGEHLRVSKGAGTQPTFEELVVELLDEVRRNVVAIFALVYRRHCRPRPSTPLLSAVFFCCKPVRAKSSTPCRPNSGVATDAFTLHSLEITARLRTTQAAATPRCARIRDVIAKWRACWRVFSLPIEQQQHQQQQQPSRNARILHALASAQSMPSGICRIAHVGCLITTSVSWQIDTRKNVV